MFWIFANLYGRFLGRPWLGPLHHTLVVLSLHGLGYDNCWKESYTGEEWFIENVLKRHGPRVCIDVGANVGMYSRLLLKHTQAKVYAVEPSSSSFSELEKTLGVVPIRAAIADYDGEATLYSKQARAGTASLDPKVSGGVAEKVRVMTLQTLADMHGIGEVDFLKIDTEGYEREVLKGLGTLRPRFVQFEFNVFHMRRHCTLYELCELLPNYTFYRLLPRGWVKIESRRFADNIFMFSNIVAVRS